MEQELRSILLKTAAAYAVAEACALSTISRRVKNDAAFFTRIAKTDKSFTARTFDEVMQWFAENWPKSAQRPFELMKWMSDTGFSSSVKP